MPRFAFVLCMSLAACRAMDVDLGTPAFDAAIDGDVSNCIDEDDDGFGEGCARGDDCDDGDSARNPGAQELCDLRDNNCNDEIDEPPLLNVGDACGSTEGECRLGVTCCRAGVVDCCGGMGPRAEACNCRDDDCDGETDEDARCPNDAPCDECACGEGCDPEGAPCPTGLLCDDRCEGASPPFSCIPTPCDGVVCEVGLVCEECTGVCIEACDSVDCGTLQCCGGDCCESWEACVGPSEGGLRCTDRSCTREDVSCPEGQVCHEHTCIDDPCADVECAEDELCRLGDCLPACPDCPDDHECVDGYCVPDPCANVGCIKEQTVCCEGECIRDVCATDVTCEPGQTCDPCTASCVMDLCPVTTCPREYRCRANECRPRHVDFPQVRTLGCVCGFAARPPPWWLIPLGGALLAGALLRPRSRRRRFRSALDDVTPRNAGDDEDRRPVVRTSRTGRLPGSPRSLG